MKRMMMLLLIVAAVTMGLFIGGCGGQDTPAGPSVNTAANPYAGRFVGKMTKVADFEAALAVDISGGKVNAAVCGPNLSGIHAGTGTCSSLGAVAFSISALDDGVAVQFSFTGSMKKNGAIVTGSGVWTSPTAGSGKWAIAMLKGASNAGSWTLTKAGSPNRTFTYDTAYAAIVGVDGVNMLAIVFDRSATPQPIDALAPVADPASALLNKPYDLSDLTMRWTWAAGQNYYAKEGTLPKVTFSKKQLNLGGKLSGKLTATLVPFGSSSPTAAWVVKAQPFADVVIARDWTP